MHSQHFDPTVYNNSLYGAVAGYDPSTLKLQHSGYAGESETNCYTNYVSSSNSQLLQGYGGREPPAYSDTTSFFHPGIMPGFGGSANYYKPPPHHPHPPPPTNVSVEINDFAQSASLPRTPESFLMKSPDSGTMGGLSDGYSCNGGNIISSGNSPASSCNTTSNNTNGHINATMAQNPNLSDPQQQHLDHRHHNLHSTSHHSDPRMHLPAPYGEEMHANVMDSSKIDQENSFFGSPHSIKIEPHTSSHHEIEKDIVTSSMTSCSVTSQKNPPKSNSDKTATTTSTTTLNSGQNSSSKSNVLLENERDNNTSSGNVKAVANADDKNGEKNNEEKKEEGDGKPTMSYIALIAKAILESDQRRLNLGSIYGWIEKHYPFYKNKGQGWRNSVRHNLSLNDCFIKAGRCEDGKGNYWAIHPANIQDFMRGDFRQRRRSRRRGRKKECDLSMYNMTNGYLPPSGAALASGMALNPAALSSIYSPYTEAERRAYRLDEALLRQSMNNPFVKWYQHGVTTPTFCPSTSPSTCTTGVYPNTGTMQWTQGYGESNPQSMYQSLNPSFPR